MKTQPTISNDKIAFQKKRDAGADLGTFLGGGIQKKFERFVDLYMY